MTQPDGSPVYYNQQYYANQVSYVPATVGANNNYMTQQQYLQQQQQQQQSNQQYVFAYVPSGGSQQSQLPNTAATAAPPSASQMQGNQYYVHPFGNVVYVPRQVYLSIFILHLVK